MQYIYAIELVCGPYWTNVGRVFVWPKARSINLPKISDHFIPLFLSPITIKIVVTCAHARTLAFVFLAPNYQ